MSWGDVVFYVWGGWAALTSVAWIFAYAKGIRTMLTMPMFRDVEPQPPAAWPRLSVVIPACNEAHTLEPAIRTMLAQDYPNLEIVLVNDRSTDGTGALVDRIAAEDERTIPIHIKELPEQWLGKVHALSVGCEQATGEWLLLSDADVHHSPGLLKKAVAYSEEQQLDHLALMPEMNSGGIGHEAVVSAFGGFFLQSFDIRKAADPNSDSYVGVGAFNLVRKTALERTEGFEWLRMEVADDVGLALLLKKSGARPGAFFANDELSITWYPNIRSMARGLEKNIYPIMSQYSPWRFSARVMGMLLMILGPFAGLAHPSPVVWLSLVAFLSVAPFAVAMRHVMKVRLISALLIPLGQLIIAGIAINSAVRCIKRGAIVWRGTPYSLNELKRFQRVKV